MRLATEYAMCARILAKRYESPQERLAQQGRMRALARIEDGDGGFLKARTASYLKSLVLNCEQVPPDQTAVFCQLLIDTAIFLLILPDTATGRSPRASRPPARPAETPGPAPPIRYARPVPERD